MASNLEWHLSSCKHAEFDMVYNLFSYYGITNRTNYVIEQIRQTVIVTEFRVCTCIYPNSLPSQSFGV